MKVPADLSKRSSRSSISSSARGADVQERIKASYLPVQYAFVQFFTEHMVDIVDTFEGDLTQMLVLSALKQRRLESQFDGLDATKLSKACMSASRIAVVLHIPRQTVNRKLATLKARGWIDSHPQGGWFIVYDAPNAPAKSAFSDFEERLNKRLAQLYIRLRHELQNEEDGPRDRLKTCGSASGQLLQSVHDPAAQ